VTSAAVARPPLVPPFTRVTGPTYWPTDALYPPLDPLRQRQRNLRALELALPPALEADIRRRFTPSRWPVEWNPPPALPRVDRGVYAPGYLKKCSAKRLQVEVTLEAGLIDRTIDAPAGLLNGLEHNRLLATHLLRLRQLWAEFERRSWPEGRLRAFSSALGIGPVRP
jgi:hypothetical protein